MLRKWSLSSLFANPIESVQEALCFAAGGSAQASIILSPDNSEVTTAQVSSIMQELQKLILCSPLPGKCRKNQGGVCKRVGHGLFQQWWSDPGRKHWKSCKQVPKEPAQALQFDVQLIRRTGPMQRTCCQLQTAVCLSVLICNYLFSGSSCITMHLNHIHCNKERKHPGASHLFTLIIDEHLLVTQEHLLCQAFS